MVEYRERRYDTGELWLGRTMANSKWRGNPCVRKASKDMLPTQKAKKMDGVMFNRNDYMIAVQWYENVPDDEEERLYERGSPGICILNSSELRLAGFEMEQVSGPRPINMRTRRGAQAAELDEMIESQKWRISVDDKQQAYNACQRVV